MPKVATAFDEKQLRPRLTVKALRTVRALWARAHVFAATHPQVLFLIHGLLS